MVLFSGNKNQRILGIFFTAIRILIGWHFLYEGLAKIFSPWSSAGYLLESQWLFSGLFHSMASSPALLHAIDILTITGLLVVGTGLFLGLLTKLSGGVGAFLVLLFYIANPPFIGYLSETTGEGHYLIVNKQLIEMVVLMLFVFLPRDYSWSLDRLIKRVSTRSGNSTPADEKSETNYSRRELLKDLISVPFLGAFVWAVLRKKQWESFEERVLVSEPSRVDAISGATARANFISLDKLKKQVPGGRIKNYEISRLICGGNLISGYAHSRDLIYVSGLVQGYFTDEKVLETFKLCEAVGINTMIIRVDTNTLRLLEKYRKRNGTMQWIAQCKFTDDNIASDIDAAIANGAIGAYLHGGVCDDYIRNNNIAWLLKALEYIKKHDGVISGLAAHNLKVIIECEKNGLEPDFYMKTLNSGNYWTAGPRLITDTSWKPDPRHIVEPEYGTDEHDNIWSLTPQQTIEFMKEVRKPWIAYKVLGAGAIHPTEGFRYAFEGGADFACVGMFDWQIVEDANILTEILDGNMERSRPWMG